MQKILITGSNGLLGQKLVYKLKDKANVQCMQLPGARTAW